MKRTFTMLAVMLLAVTVRIVAAQDAKAVVQAASAAMGAANVKSIQMTGTGWNAGVGQSYSPEEDWPRFDVTRYTRTIDYEGKSSREELTRRQGNNPPRGGGGTPLQGDQQQMTIVSGTYAWNVADGKPVPQPGLYQAGIPVAEFRQLDLLLTPHGFLKAAMAATDLKAISLTLPTGPGNITENGKATLVSFTVMGKYKAVGTFNDQHLLELVQSRIANPFYGDMLYELRYTNYKDFGGVKFPTRWHIHVGDPRLDGHNAMEITFTSVQPNVTVERIAVPDAVRTATAPAERAVSQKLADGVWLVGGGSHNSLAVDFRDFAAVIEAPLNEERSLAVIKEVGTIIPNKPIRYIVNTHHHFDHSGGLRTYIAQGATLITHQANRDYYDRILFSPAPRMLQPDRFSEYYPYFGPGRRELPFIETVNQKYVLSDGVRTIDVYPVEGLDHAATMLMVYLPKEKILVNADLYSPPAQGTPLPAPNANIRTLRQNIQRLKLDVSQHVPIHGQPGPNDPFVQVASK